MIQINNKKDCCGCHACSNACPKQCITMQADKEGFLYPIVDKETCIDCGLCEKVCPVINQSEPRKPLHVYAAYNRNENIRMQSSSGGIFTLLAEAIINEGGVVFGAKFDKDWNVVHDYTETIEGIAAFRGSKYVQSTIGNTYSQAKKYLQAGRKVLFSGTPCQIAGLKKYLRKEYDNLLTVDIICHGVPSPKVWSMYLNETTEKQGITFISMRDKRNSWKKYNITIKTKKSTITKHAYECAYIKGFLSNLYLRPSCHSCPAKLNKSNSDITIADFWGIDIIDFHFDDDRGCNALFINTNLGNDLIESLYNEFLYKQKTLEQAILKNKSYNTSPYLHPHRKKFFKRLDNADNISSLIMALRRVSFISRIINKIKRYAKAILRKT